MAHGAITELRPADGEVSACFAMPAFVDAHWHLFWAGFEATSLLLDAARSKRELLDCVARAVKAGPELVRGEKLDESAWDAPELPTLAELDRATGAVPVFLRRVCGHLALANSALLRRLPAEIAAPVAATGVLKEKPVLDFDRMFPRSMADSAAAMHRAAALALAHGVTAVGSMEPLRHCQMLAEHDLAIDVRYAAFAEDLAELEGWLSSPGQAGLPAGLFGLKLFLDGGLGAMTAAVASGFVDGTHGQLIYEDGALLESLRKAVGLGLQPVVHAIGGRALQQLDRVSQALCAELPRARQLGIRVEHAEELAAAWPGGWDRAVHRFSMQPNFVRRWQMPDGMYAHKLGWPAARSLNPFALVHHARFELGFGSDGMPFGPLWGLTGALQHPNPAERLSLHAALHAYTLGAARLCGFEALAQPLGPGRRADLVLLSDSPFRVEALDELKVLGVIRRGELVYGDPGLLGTGSVRA